MVPHTHPNRSLRRSPIGIIFGSTALDGMIPEMALHTTTGRRWFGIAFLGCALLMLIIGQTILNNRLRDLAFLVYWLLCFAFTGLAVAIALLDARENRRRLRQERRDLLHTTLKDIQSDAQKRRRHNGKQKPL